MPLDVNYPGVYVEELPSGRHSIFPVSTSVTAFIGRAPIGPIDIPITVYNFGDFQTNFGGLEFDCPMSYAVRDFFSNGGSEAIIVRLFEHSPGHGSGVATFMFAPPGSTQVSGGLVLEAANPGVWGNRLLVNVDNRGITSATARQFAEYDLKAKDLFNITVTLEDINGNVAKSERYLNLAVKNTGESSKFPNRMDRVLETQSNLIRVQELSKRPPANGESCAGIGGHDGIYLKTKTYLGDQANKTGIYMLDNMPIFNLLCIPPDRRVLPTTPISDQDLDPVVRQAVAEYCTDRRAFYIVDPPAEWTNKVNQGQLTQINPTDVGISGENKTGIEVERNAAVFFPRIWQEDLQMKNQPAIFAPSGAIAGIFAATDVSRGVWKTPAGTDAALANVSKLEVNLNDDQNGILNPLGVNCLRTFRTIGSVVWGGRTMRGADVYADDYKYISVRRLTLFIEQSLIHGTQWAAFEPNDEALWSSLRLEVNSFLAELSKQGAFYNYKVACDATTTTPTDIEKGIVNIQVLIAPVDPAEFVVIQIQQDAGGATS